MKRKVLAMVLATTMVFGSSVTVFAADGDGTGSATGSGDVQYENTTIYSVTVPTNQALTLVVDPQGLSGLANGATATAEDLEAYAGRVTCEGLALINNLSSVPTKVSVELTLTGDAVGVDTENAVNDATTKENNILLYAVPSADDVAGDTTKYVPSTTGIVIGKTAQTVSFVLPEATYNFTKDDEGNVSYAIAEGEKGHGTALAFEGLVNKEADWTDFTDAAEDEQKVIGMSAAFTFTHNLSDDDVVATTEGNPYMMMDASALKTVVVAPKEKAPGFAKTEYTLVADQALVIPVDLGLGDLAATKVTSVMWNNIEMLSADGKYCGYDATAKTITFSVESVNSFLSDNGAKLPANMTVSFDKGDAVSISLVQ